MNTVVPQTKLAPPAWLATVPSDRQSINRWSLYRWENGVRAHFNHDGSSLKRPVHEASSTFAQVGAVLDHYDGIVVFWNQQPQYFGEQQPPKRQQVPTLMLVSSAVGEQPANVGSEVPAIPNVQPDVSPTKQPKKDASTESPAMVSGFGQYHTNEADPEKPEKKLTPYAMIDLAGIRSLVDEPQQVDKSEAQWFIPSSLSSRTFATQEQRGEYWMLWADMDTDPKPLSEVEAILRQIITGADFEIYTSSSAREDYQKGRILIPLGKPLPGGDWVLVQHILNNKLQAAGITPDIKSEGPAQLCYLPNRGAFYDKRSVRGGYCFDPTSWANEIEAIQQEIDRKEKEIKERKTLAKGRREARTTTEGLSLIEAFNQSYTVEEILIRAGYDQRGDKFRHPHSASGSFSASVKDGRVHSLSSSDLLYTGGGGGGAHDAFSTFCVLYAGGEQSDALKLAGEQWLTIAGEPWNKVKQREWAQRKAAEELAGIDLSGILNQAPKSNTTKGIQENSSHANGAGSNQSDHESRASTSTYAWPDPVDPFGDYVAPQFPVDLLPQVMAKYCHEQSAQSGFDAGGYAFAMLIAASNMIDHRAKMTAGPLSAPAFLWGGLMAGAGGGKSPIIKAVMRWARRINDQLVHDSNTERAEFIRKTAHLKPKEFSEVPQPAWRQLIASDATVEALGHLMKDNPRGMFLVFDEMTEFIGRMDAYSGSSGSGKDRGVHLHAYDGGPQVTNRSGKSPTVIDNFSEGVLTGVQPEKLASMFRKSADGSDGLYQRFLFYSLPKSGKVNYGAHIGTFTETNCGRVFETLHQWSEGKVIADLSVAPDVAIAMQGYHNNMRTIAQREPFERLAEHIDKFPGFLARILFTLHCCECADRGQFSRTVTIETFKRAKQVAHVLFHHSRSVYEVVGQRGGDANRLMKSACNAILSKGWTSFQRGDLTRDATDWREADGHQAEGAIDLLIELGWIHDITPTLAGRRGRRSSGHFLVNPEAHKRYIDQTQRIVKERAERYAAIQDAAETKRNRPWE